MPFSTDVRLPRDVEPVFPDACCACGAAAPGNTVAIKGRRVRWSELFWPWLWFFGKRIVVAVPVCAACQPRLRSSRRWQTVILLASVAVAIPILFPLAKSFGFGWRTTKAIGAVLTLVAVLPVVLWQMLHPPVFDITVGKDHVDYEFASSDYALRFRAANPAASEREP
ncbi:MAG: hypothetical protein JNK15_09025 [Planctomycetes bacterium]|nr:hypothetical protein [Planctomycetota bacterium]